MNEHHKRYAAFKQLKAAANHLLDELILGASSTVPQHSGAFHPLVDVTETASEIIVTAEIPGVKVDDVEVTLLEDRLFVCGEKVVGKEDNALGYHHIERQHGRFDRTILMPCAIDSDHLQASCKDGVLRVVLRKSAEHCRTAKTIEINKS